MGQRGRARVVLPARTRGLVPGSPPYSSCGTGTGMRGPRHWGVAIVSAGRRWLTLLRNASHMPQRFMPLSADGPCIRAGRKRRGFGGRAPAAASPSRPRCHPGTNSPAQCAPVLAPVQGAQDEVSLGSRDCRGGVFRFSGYEARASGCHLWVRRVPSSVRFTAVGDGCRTPDGVCATGRGLLLKHGSSGPRDEDHS